MGAMRTIVICQLVFLSACSVDTDGYTFVSMGDTDAGTSSENAVVTGSDSNSRTIIDTPATDGIDSGSDSHTGANFYADTSSATSDGDNESDSDTHSEGEADSSFDFDTNTEIVTPAGAETETDTDSETDVVSTGIVDTATEDTGTADTHTNDTGTMCAPTNGGQEICDGIDNDCDGDVDEEADIDLRTDPANCGGCGNDCMTDASLWTEFGDRLPLHMKSATCTSGYCEVSECEAGFQDDSGFPYKDCRFYVKELALGYGHTCAVFFDDTVKCWGANGAGGQLGQDYNFVESSVVPLSVAGLPVSSDVSIKKLAAGSPHTCAWLSDDSIYCWGNNGLGALGRDALDEYGYIPEPVTGIDLPEGVTIEDMTVGGYHNCVLLSNGSVQCWGFNDYLQLGRDTGAESSSSVPGPLDYPSWTVGNPVVALAAGELHNCVWLSDDTVHCWGQNNASQLGRVTGTGGILEDDSNPASVENFSLGVGVTIQSLVSGSHHTCVLLSDNSVECWGYNLYGQLGRTTDTASDYMYPAKVTGLALSAGTTIESVSAGGYHTCVLLSSDDILCWGQNDRGQLGRETGTNTFSSTPGLVTGFTLDDGVSIRALSANGSGHSCVLLSDNTVHCWGSNGAGQLGRETGSEDFSADPAPVQNLY